MDLENLTQLRYSTTSPGEFIHRIKFSSMVVAISINIESTFLSTFKPDLYNVSEVCAGLPLSKKPVYGMTHAPTYEGFGSHDPGL